MRLLYTSLLPYFRRYRWLLLVGCVFVVISNVFAIYPAQVIRTAFDDVARELEANPNQEGQPDIVPQLLYYAAVVLGLALIRGVFMVLMRQAIIVVSHRMIFDLKNRLFEHYQGFSLRTLRQHKTGDLMARIAEDVSHIRMFLGPGIMYTVNTLSLLVMVVATMLAVNPELTLYVAAPLPVLSLLIYYIHSLVIRRSEERQAQLSVLSSYTQEAYSGIRLLKAYGREKPFLEDFERESNEFNRRSMRLVYIDSVFFPAILFLIGLSTLFTVWLGGQKVAAGSLSLGNIAEFIIYINLMVWPVASLGWVTSLIQRAIASQKRINEVLAVRSELHYPDTSPAVTHAGFRLQAVGLTYPETGIRALHNIHLEVQPGQVLGVVGPTGSGKTSFVNVLVRLLDPDTGSVELDGRPIASYSRQALRSVVGYVPQDGFLFSDTVADNIAFGRPGASRAEVEEAARFAGVYDDILGFPKQFDTLIGERGVTLSGGQKQRVAIARAWLQNPKLLVLDDSLSAVDTETEERILHNLRTQAQPGHQPPTMVIVSHRISTVQHAHQILVLQDGQAVGLGTHQHLLQNCPLYRRLHEQQQLETELSA